MENQNNDPFASMTPPEHKKEPAPSAGQGDDKPKTEPQQQVQPAATPAPSEPVAPEPTQTTETEDEIRDPQAWAKAQTEKFQRLHAKEEARVKELQDRLAKMETEQQQDFQRQIDDIKASMETQTKAALDALKDTAVSTLGLDDTAKSLLTGTDAETLQAQIAALANLKPAPSGQRPAIGNSGQTVKPSKAQEIHEYGKHKGHDADVWGRIAAHKDED